MVLITSSYFGTYKTRLPNMGRPAVCCLFGLWQAYKAAGFIFPMMPINLMMDMAEAINAEAAFKIFSNNLSFPNVALLSVIHSWSDNADVLNVTDRIYCCIPFIYGGTQMNVPPYVRSPVSFPPNYVLYSSNISP